MTGSENATLRQDKAGAAASNLTVPAETLTRLFETAIRIRTFDERATELFKEGLVKGTAHSYVGEEAIAAGACLNLEQSDYIGSYHRGHGHCIAKGASMDKMMAELLGRDTGACRGLGGSMHIADMALNILGANGIVGATMPLGAGAALAAKLRKSNQVVIAFFGDGASNQGVFHEAMNLASIWKLPMIFICENNQWALTTSYLDTTSVDHVAKRASAYSMPGITVDGNDALEVYRVVGEAVERARAGEGPTLIEAMTWRWGQHSMRTNTLDKRTPEQMQSWKEKDPVLLLANRIRTELPDGEEIVATMTRNAEEEVEAALQFALKSPEASVAVMTDSVYAPHLAHREPTSAGSRELTYVEALNEALRQEMRRDEEVFVMGEDVGEADGLFKVTEGLFREFGGERVRDTPISEATFCGAGVGAAIAGMRPVIEVQIFDFVTQMMDMIVNQAAKFRFMNGGIPKVPLVIRGPQGGGIRLAAQHSQSLEAWFAHIPGLVVVAPSTPFDAKGLLISSIRDDNPVIFLEHKMLYLGQRGPVPEEPYAIPLGKGDIKREGTDVTIVATQFMVQRALAAAAQLERDGISVEVIDPRTIRPLDEDLILSSVKKTSRLVIVHEACLTGGFGAEISALVNEKAFDWLDAPVTRVGGLDVPMPYNDQLEQTVMPNQARIVAAVQSVLARA